MTYAERIEVMAKALAVANNEEWADLDEKWNTSFGYARDRYRGLARAADVACLKAIEEPTEEMCDAAANEMNGWDRRFDRAQTHLWNSWLLMHAAIPRGDK